MNIKIPFISKKFNGKSYQNQKINVVKVIQIGIENRMREISKKNENARMLSSYFVFAFVSLEITKRGSFASERHRCSLSWNCSICIWLFKKIKLFLQKL